MPGVVGGQQHRTWEGLEEGQEGVEELAKRNGGHRSPPKVEASFMDEEAVDFCCFLMHVAGWHGVGVEGYPPTDG